jgi:hypothetical protein
VRGIRGGGGRGPHGGGGRAKIDAGGRNVAGKGIWVVQGTNTVIESIELSGAKVPDFNGAGIRYADLDP